MKFPPKSDKELAEMGLLPRGEYDYEIVAASKAVSSKGNEMIKLTLRIFYGESERTVFDYLLAAMANKLKQFCYSHGLVDAYESGNLEAHECESLTGTCVIGIKKDKTGAYPDANQILEYVVPVVAAPKAKSAAALMTTTGVDDGDIPF